MKLVPKASELEARDIERTRAARRVAENSTRKAEIAQAHVERVVGALLDAARASPDIDVDEEDTAIRRLASRSQGSLDAVRQTDRVIIATGQLAAITSACAILRSEGYDIRLRAVGLSEHEVNEILARPPPQTCPVLIVPSLATPELKTLSGMGVSPMPPPIPVDRLCEVVRTRVTAWLSRLARQ